MVGQQLAARQGDEVINNLMKSQDNTGKFGVSGNLMRIVISI